MLSKQRAVNISKHTSRILTIHLQLLLCFSMLPLLPADFRSTHTHKHSTQASCCCSVSDRNVACAFALFFVSLCVCCVCSVSAFLQAFSLRTTRSFTLLLSSSRSLNFFLLFFRCHIGTKFATISYHFYYAGNTRSRFELFCFCFVVLFLPSFSIRNHNTLPYLLVTTPPA